MNTSEMKYIVVRIEYPHGGNTIDYVRSSPEPFVQELPVVFPKPLTHVQMLESMRANRDIWNNDPDIVAAGFCYVDENGWVCHGESTSIRDAGWKEGYASRGKVDEELLNNFSSHYGMKEKE